MKLIEDLDKMIKEKSEELREFISGEDENC
jgi:hypothetical protein